MVDRFYTWIDSVHKCVNGTVTRGIIKSDVENLTRNEMVTIEYDDGTKEVLTKFALEHREFITNESELGDPPKYLYFNTRYDFVEWADEYDAHNRFGGDNLYFPFGPDGMEGPLNMPAFFQYTQMVRAHYEKWHDMTTGPLREMGVDPNAIGYAVWEKMLKEVLCG